MQRYEASRLSPADEHGKLVTVSSKRCRYFVRFFDTETLVQLTGPGVDEEAECIDTYQFDSLEDAGIFYVLLFESGLWPEN